MGEPTFNQEFEGIEHACTACRRPQLAFVPAALTLKTTAAWNYLNCSACRRPTLHSWKQGGARG